MNVGLRRKRQSRNADHNVSILNFGVVVEIASGAEASKMMILRQAH